jgi:type I restriction enzyme M protein
MERDKVSMDILWLRDDSFEDADNLPSPDILAAEIVEDLQAALGEFAEIARTLSPGNSFAATEAMRVADSED